MYKVKIEGIGPLSYISKDRDSGHDALKLKAGETAEVEFEERLWVWGSPFNLARCNVIITPLQSSEQKASEQE